jgi:hypothetical protein
MHWDHMALTLERRYYGTMDDPFSEWAARLPDGTDLEGLQVILDHLSTQGWEMIGLLPTSWGKTDAKALTAIFKRPHA